MNNLFYEPITTNYFKTLLYNNKGKTTYFDRINNLEENEFEFDSPATNVEENATQELNFKSYMLNCL